MTVTNIRRKLANAPLDQRIAAALAGSPSNIDVEALV
jgi:hypothetical protein